MTLGHYEVIPASEVAALAADPDRDQLICLRHALRRLELLVAAVRRAPAPLHCLPRVARTPGAPGHETLLVGIGVVTNETRGVPAVGWSAVEVGTAGGASPEPVLRRHGGIKVGFGQPALQADRVAELELALDVIGTMPARLGATNLLTDVVLHVKRADGPCDLEASPQLAVLVDRHQVERPVPVEDHVAALIIEPHAGEVAPDRFFARILVHHSVGMRLPGVEIFLVILLVTFDAGVGTDVVLWMDVAVTGSGIEPQRQTYSSREKSAQQNPALSMPAHSRFL